MVDFSVAINNFNYERFVVEAIESALAQTHPPFEIIVVDDGSTDGSVDLIKRLYDQRVRLIQSENFGQMSAFRLAVRHARGDVVAFLDADDRWMPHHLATVAARMSAEPRPDFVIAAHKTFGNQVRIEPSDGKDVDFGYTTLAGLTGEWLGGPTSCLSVRRELLAFIEDLAPKTIEEWRLRADDVVIFGAGIAGARKYKLGQPSVEYRMHGKNGFQGRVRSAAEVAAHRQKVRCLNEELHRICFPGLTPTDIIGFELKRNRLRKLRNKRNLIRATWGCTARLLEKLGTTAAIVVAP